LISEAEAPGSGAKKFGTFRRVPIKKRVGKWRKMSNKKGAKTALQFAPKIFGKLFDCGQYPLGMYLCIAIGDKAHSG